MVGNKEIVLRELIGNQRGFLLSALENLILVLREVIQTLFDNNVLSKALWPNG